VPASFDAELVERLKYEVLGGRPANTAKRNSEPAMAVAGQPDLSTGLVESWQRSGAAIGVPSDLREVPHVSETLLDQHVLDMFQAPLTRFAETLEGTGLALLLADSRGQILQRWCRDTSASIHLDRIGTLRGAVLAEEAVGTNGVGTVIAAGRSVQIRGSEHFADFYREAVCTGAPVRHPISKQVLGVITLSCDVTPRVEFLKPLLESMREQLEQHVLDVEEPAARQMFLHFLKLSRERSEPVFAFGPQGLLVQNSPANRVIPADLERIRRVWEGGVPNGRYPLELSTGAAHAHVTTLGLGTSIVLIEDRPRNAGVFLPHDRARRVPLLIGRSPDWLFARHQLDKFRCLPGLTVVAGEAGAGKVSLALGRPYRRHAGISSNVVDAAERHVLGGRKWLQQVAARIQAEGDLVVRGVQTLDAAVLDGLRSLLTSAPADKHILVTLAAQTREDAEAFAANLGAHCVWVPPLRDRGSDLVALFETFTAEEPTASRPRLQKDAAEVLRAYSWPGNLNELRSLVRQLAATLGAGSVSAADLPASMQGARTLSMIERVEVEAIRKALAEADGNRGKAAEILGLSRATIYRKMKAYHLTG
jgi:transcriptional regulator of acetoin/glycerol metabolism